MYWVEKVIQNDKSSNILVIKCTENGKVVLRMVKVTLRFKMG